MKRMSLADLNKNKCDIRIQGTASNIESKDIEIIKINKKIKKTEIYVNGKLHGSQG